MSVEAIAQNLGLGALLSDLRVNFGGYEILDHWTRGEFHHDLLLHVESKGRLPGPVLVVATNCNGGVKEVLCLASPPREEALWHFRCPDAPEFSGALPAVVGQARTVHWFDPCALLAPDARSEYRAEFRERQPGGGWQLKGCGVQQPAASADGLFEVEILSKDHGLLVPDETGLPGPIQVGRVLVTHAGSPRSIVVVRSASISVMLPANELVAKVFPSEFVACVRGDVEGETTLSCGDADEATLFSVAAAAATLKRSWGWDDSPTITVKLARGLEITIDPVAVDGRWRVVRRAHA